MAIEGVEAIMMLALASAVELLPNLIIASASGNLKTRRGPGVLSGSEFL